MNIERTLQFFPERQMKKKYKSMNFWKPTNKNDYMFAATPWLEVELGKSGM